MRPCGKSSGLVLGLLRVSVMQPPDYLGPYDARAGMYPGLSASLSSLHPFFPHALMPEAPLSDDDISLFMLLVTYSDALDALPLEATRSFSDLRELDAVLGGTSSFVLTQPILAHSRTDSTIWLRSWRIPRLLPQSDCLL